MGAGPARRNVGVVDGRMNGHRSGRTGVLVHLLVQDCLQLVVAHVGLVEDDVVVGRARSALDGGVRAEVEVVLVGVALRKISCRLLERRKEIGDALTTPESTSVPGRGLPLRSPFSGKKRTW